MLKLDFSNITTDKGKLNLIESFEKSVIDSVEDFLNKYELTLNFSKDKQKYNNSISDMKQYYNGYLFSEDGENRIFNPNMVLYFLDSLI